MHALRLHPRSPNHPRLRAHIGGASLWPTQRMPSHTLFAGGRCSQRSSRACVTPQNSPLQAIHPFHGANVVRSTSMACKAVPLVSAFSGQGAHNGWTTGLFGRNRLMTNVDRNGPMDNADLADRDGRADSAGHIGWMKNVHRNRRGSPYPEASFLAEAPGRPAITRSLLMWMASDTSGFVKQDLYVCVCVCVCMYIQRSTMLSRRESRPTSMKTISQLSAAQNEVSMCLCAYAHICMWMCMLSYFQDNFLRIQKRFS